LTTAVRNPTWLTERATVDPPVAPEFRALLTSISDTPDGFIERLPRYVEAYIEASPNLLSEYQGGIADPDVLLAGLRDLAYFPDRFVASTTPTEFAASASALSSYYARSDIAARADAARVPVAEFRASVMADGSLTASDSALVAIDDLDATLAGIPADADATRLSNDLATARSYLESAAADLESNPPTGLDADDITSFVSTVRVALVSIREVAPWNRLARLDAVFDSIDAGAPTYSLDGTEDADATCGSEFVFFLTELATAVETVGISPADESTTRDTFSTTYEAAIRTLADTDALTTLRSVRSRTAVGDTFRRCTLETLRVPIVWASYFGAYASTPRSAVGGTISDQQVLVRQARALAERLEERLAAATAHAETTSAEAGLGEDASSEPDAQVDPTRVDAAVDRIQALLGDTFRVLPPFVPENRGEVAQTFDSGHEEALLSRGEPLSVETWLQRTARVRERPAELRRVLTYAGAVTDRHPRDDLQVGQLPYRTDDDWVGLDVEGLSVERGQVSLVSLFASRHSVDSPVARDDRVAAFLVDEWRTAVPADAETTGVAFQYDDPGNEPPQSVLLGLSPDGTWTTEDVVRLVLETRDLAKLRGVDLKALGKPKAGEQYALGHLLPALLFPNNTMHRPDVPSVDFGLESDLLDSLEFLPAMLDPVYVAQSAETVVNGGDDAAESGGDSP